MAAVAEQEAEAISKRTKAALHAAKERGTKLGGLRVSPERFAEIAADARKERTARVIKQRGELLPAITQIQAEGATTLRAIAAQLNAREIEAPRGGQWAAVQVRRVLN
jgi:DNA invertase Pin-like site-specific DNA recombinase